MTDKTKSLLRQGLLCLSRAAYDLDNFEFKSAREYLISTNAYLQEVARIEEMNGNADSMPTKMVD